MSIADFHSGAAVPRTLDAPPRARRSAVARVAGPAPRARLVWILSAAIAISVAAVAEEPAQNAGRPTYAKLIEQLVSTVEAIRANDRDRAAAWPDREAAQLAEAKPPFAVRELQEARRVLEGRRARIERQLAAQAAQNAAPLLELAARSDDVQVLESVLPILTGLAGQRAAVSATVLAIANRLEEWPVFLVDALSTIGAQEADFRLLERGLRDRDARLVRAAVRNGDPEVVESILQLLVETKAEAEREALRSSLSAIPTQRMTERLAALLESWIERAADEHLKAALVVPLGLRRDPGEVRFFERLYASAKSKQLRCALIAALGNAGGGGGEILLKMLEEAPETSELRVPLVHALGRSGFRPAVPELIEGLRDPDVRVESRQALARIAGDDLGAQPGHWERWWASQPECPRSPFDEDL